MNKVTDAIVLRGDESKWCTPSGAFLDLLREFAREEKIGEIAEACRMYFSAYRFARGFVSSALPAIILNHYQPLTDGFDFARFLEWSVDNEDWADQIAAHASSLGPHFGHCGHEGLNQGILKFATINKTYQLGRQEPGTRTPASNMRS